MNTINNFEIFEEKTELPNCTLVRGKYKDKKFSMKFFLDHSYTVKGEFTDIEKDEIYKKYIKQL